MGTVYAKLSDIHFGMSLRIHPIDLLKLLAPCQRTLHWQRMAVYLFCWGLLGRFEPPAWPSGCKFVVYCPYLTTAILAQATPVAERSGMIGRWPFRHFLLLVYHERQVERSPGASVCSLNPFYKSIQIEVVTRNGFEEKDVVTSYSFDGSISK